MIANSAMPNAIVIRTAGMLAKRILARAGLEPQARLSAARKAPAFKSMFHAFSMAAA